MISTGLPRMTQRTVTTDGTGRCEMPPDRATVEVTALGEGNSARDARAMVTDRAASIRDTVADISSSQVLTIDIRVEDSDDVYGTKVDTPFQARRKLQIECSPEAVESVVVAVTDSGGRIQTVQFRLKESIYRKSTHEALSSAMKRARDKAEHIAAVEGAVLGAVQEVNVQPLKTNSGMDMIVEDALASHDTNLHPSPITVSKRVEAVYQLESE